MRRVQLPIAGRWYISMLLLIAAVSLISSNNVVYLMLAMLIAGLIISFALARRAAGAVSVDVRRRPIRVGGDNHDLIMIRNESYFPVFCIEVEEWSEGKPRRLAFIPYLKGRAKAVIPAGAVYEKRGSLSWDAIGVSTTYPYGFLRVIERVPHPGTRLVWPAPKIDESHATASSEGQTSTPSGGAILEGEVRPMNFDDDSRSIVWTLSARGGDLMVRMRARERQMKGLALDLRSDAGADFEMRVSEMATRVYELGETDQDSLALTLVDWEGRRQVRGRTRVLDCLALVQPQGAKMPERREGA